jgi:hypothetical protein
MADSESPLAKLTPNPAFPILAFLLGCFAAFFAFTLGIPGTDIGSQILFGLMAAGMVTLAVYFVAISVFTGSTAYDDRIAVRSLRYRQFVAPWEDVTDYYDEVGRNALSVIFVGGRRLAFGPRWNGYDAFRDVVRLRATKAKAKEWAVYETRREDEWPRVFAGPARDAKQATVVMSVCALILVAMSVSMVPDFMRSVAELYSVSPLYGVGCVVFVVVAAGAFGTLALTSLARSAAKAPTVTITCDPDGIAMADGTTRVYADWQRVRSYVRAPGLKALIDHPAVYQVNTDNGTITFPVGLCDSAVLAKIIETYAVNVDKPGWRRLISDELPVARRR